ncbi:MAG: hypothetical protein AD073_000259 [Mycoplasmataceae bacterium]|nr:MAG: hypothetical protein AD073_000259 [Mycoplasmataceae bacterium]
MFFSWSWENILSKTNQEIGIDLGIKYFLANSNSQLITNPRYPKQSEKKLELNHQIVSRRIKGSNRRNKAIKVLSSAYEKVVNQRKDFLRKLSKELINKNDLIAIEDLKIKSMLQSKNSNKNLNKYYKES